MRPRYTSTFAAATVLSAVTASSTSFGESEKPAISDENVTMFAPSDMPSIFSSGSHIAGEPRRDLGFSAGLALPSNFAEHLEDPADPRSEYVHHWGRFDYQGNSDFISFITGDSGDIVFVKETKPEEGFPEVEAFSITTAYITEDVQIGLTGSQKPWNISYMQGVEAEEPVRVTITARLTEVTQDNPLAVGAATSAILKAGKTYNDALKQVSFVETLELKKRLEEDRPDRYDPNKGFSYMSGPIRGYIAPVLENDEGRLVICPDQDFEGTPGEFGSINVPGAEIESQPLDPIFLSKHPILIMNPQIITEDNGDIILRADGLLPNTHEAVFAYGQAGFAGQAFLKANSGQGAFPDVSGENRDLSGIETVTIEILSLGTADTSSFPYHPTTLEEYIWVPKDDRELEVETDGLTLGF